jgi:hypothetical protein
VKKWRVRSRADTSVLFRRLRLAAQENEYVLYNVLVRRAGIGFAYVETGKVCDGETDVFSKSIVFCYHRGSLRNAVKRELERWRGRP